MDTYLVEQCDQYLSRYAKPAKCTLLLPLILFGISIFLYKKSSLSCLTNLYSLTQVALTHLHDVVNYGEHAQRPVRAQLQRHGAEALGERQDALG